MPKFAKTYQMSDMDKFPTIDGQEFPWYVSADPGPRVEDIGRGVHILWVPIQVDAPLPSPPVGSPDGEPLDLSGGVPDA